MRLQKTLEIKDSNRLYFTSDLHLGHEGIIKHCNRPFSDKKEMDHAIISNWNSLITDNDLVVIAGDFCLGGLQMWVYYLSHLKGNKILVLGNHDHNVPANMFLDVTSLLNIEVIDFDTKKPQRITVCHYPMLSWHQSHRGAWQLFGHWHGKSIKSRGNDEVESFVKEEKLQIDKVTNRQYDVGVDNNYFYPVHYNSIKQIMDKKAK